MALLPFTVFLFILPFPGTVALRLLCLVIMVFLVALSWKQLEVPALPSVWPLAIWIAVAVLSLGYAVDPAYSLGELKNEIGYTLMAFVAFLAWCDGDRRVRWFCLTVLGSTTVISVWGIGHYLTYGQWGEASAFGGSGAFGSLAAIAVPVAAAVHIASGPRIRRLIIVALAVVLIAVMLSHQRIILIVFGVQGVILVWLLAGRRLRAGRRVWAAIAGVAVLTAAGTSVLYLHKSKMDESLAEFQSLSNDMRLDHWKRIWDRIVERPYTGAGFGRDSMRRAYPDLVPDKPPYSLLWHPHNVFLTYGVGMGWPGVFSLLFLMAGLCLWYLKLSSLDGDEARWVSVAGVCLVIGVVIRNQTNDFFLRDGALMFWSLNGIFLGYLLRLARLAQPVSVPR